MSMKEENNDYDKYLDVTRSIGKTRKESWDYVEKRMYAIATGALALSITLLSFTFDKVNGIHNKWLIITSWCCLVLSILVNFLSHYISYTEAGDAIKDIYKLIEENQKYEPKTINEIIDNHNSITKYLNVFSMFTLAFGVCGILAFYIIEIVCFV